MYKKQLRLQKILCFIAIGVSAAIFIYSLGLVTDLYDALYTTMPNPNNLSYTEVPGSYVYYEIQDFNHALMLSAIGMILLSVLLFITNTHSRRRYYIGNYTATGLFVASSVVLSVWGHGEMEYYKAQFLKIDFNALWDFADLWETLYTESTFWFDAHYVLFGLLLIVAVLLVVNALWKTVLMKQEAALLRRA